MDLAAVLRWRQEAILDRWESAMRRVPQAAQLPAPLLVDYVPELLSRLGEAIETAGDGAELEETTAERHALERLGHGFDLGELIRELTALRDAIVAVWSEDGVDARDVQKQRLLSRVVDQTIEAAVTTYSELSDSLLRCLERVASLAVSADSLEEFLDRLVSVIPKQVPGVDAMAIFLREGDELTMRAEWGLEGPKGFKVRVGEGHLGAAAAECRVTELDSRDGDPIAALPAVRAGEFKVLHGVPLCEDGRVLGVAEIASREVDASGVHQRTRLTSIAERVTAGIRQHVMRERLAFISRASELLGSSLDLDETIQQLADLAVPVLADICAVHLAAVEGPSRLAAVAHARAEVSETVQRLRRPYPPVEQAPAAVAGALKEGEPRLVREVSDEVLRGMAVDDDHLDVLRALGLRSLLFLPLMEKGRASGLMTLAHADSGRSFGEDELELASELARRASSAIEAAHLHERTERAVRLRDQVLAVVSHDLRNPIGTISLAAGLLARKPSVRDDPGALDQVETISRNTSRATRLIEDLLDVSSIQTGTLSLQRGWHALAPLLEEVADAHEPQAHKANISLRRDIRVGEQGLCCDRDRLMQVLENLLGNALKFCSPGDDVLLSAEVTARDIRIAVADTGPGIPEEECERIFSMYWRRPSRARGTGLGLFIARGIVEAHGGELTVDSRIGEGSTFVISLPLGELT